MKRERKSLPPVRRIQRICAMLNRARVPIPVRRFAEELEVSHKAIERDLSFMKDQLELPIVTVPSKGQWLLEKIKLCRCCAGRLNPVTKRDKPKC